MACSWPKYEIADDNGGDNTCMSFDALDTMNLTGVQSQIRGENNKNLPSDLFALPVNFRPHAVGLSQSKLLTLLQKRWVDRVLVRVE